MSSSYKLPNNFNITNTGLNVNKSGGLSYNVPSSGLTRYPQSGGSANPINFGYTAASGGSVLPASTQRVTTSPGGAPSGGAPSGNNGSGGGGGGGGGGQDNSAAQYGYPNMSMDEYNAEIQNYYNAGMGAWNVAEQNANRDLADVTECSIRLRQPTQHK